MGLKQTIKNMIRAQIKSDTPKQGSGYKVLVRKTGEVIKKVKFINKFSF